MMEEKNGRLGLLNLVDRPILVVRQNTVVWQNLAANALHIPEGIDITRQIVGGRETYLQYSGGTLCIALDIEGSILDTTVIREAEGDLFLIEPELPDPVTRAMALASSELRRPLDNAMIAANGIKSEQIGQLRRSLNQIQRILCNMADAGAPIRKQPEMRSITAVFGEIFERTMFYVEKCGYHLVYTPPEADILCPLLEEDVERAIMNLLSNAMRFSPPESTIRAGVSSNDTTVFLQILDSGCGIADEIRSTIFTRYLRTPGLEDSRLGMGLGLVIVRNTAAIHGGAVLFDQPGNSGTRVTMTFSRKAANHVVSRYPKLRVDYAGELDHGLLEFSQILPVEAYEGLWR